MVKVAIQYITRKFCRYILSFFIIITLNFFIPRLMPGDPFINILGEEFYYADPELVEGLKTKYGLNKPLHEQYIAYLINLAHCNWGYSFHYMQPVFDVIALRLKWTLLLLMPSIVLGTIIGMIAGSIAGWRNKSKLYRYWRKIS